MNEYVPILALFCLPIAIWIKIESSKGTKDLGTVPASNWDQVQGLNLDCLKLSALACIDI